MTMRPQDEAMFQQALAASRRLSRRRFLGGAGAVLGGLAAGPTLLAACGGGSNDDEESGNGSENEKTTSKGSGTAERNDVYHANWTLYIDDETPKLWEQETNKKLFYSEEYNDNNEYFAKIRPELSQGKPIKPDIITPTFWLAGRLINLGWVDKIPFDQIPNASNLVERLQKPTWDPTGEYSLPWQSGMAGIAYNRKVTGGDIRSVDDLFDPKYKGKIAMLTEMRDTMGILGLWTGADLSKPRFDDFSEAFDRLEKAVADGQIRRFTGNDYTDDLSSGNLAICIGWSGDIVQLARDNPDLGFSIPESGGTLWSDTMVMPKGGKRQADAASWMDFVYDPVNAARIAAEVQYISPVEGVRDELIKMGGDAAALADSPLLFPDDETASRLRSWGNLDEDEEARFDERFASITGN